MARYIEQGKSIFIPFHNGVSITDSQLHLRMYKTEEMFKRHFPPNTKYDVLCEYAPVVRCKDCKHRGDDGHCPMCYEEASAYDDGEGYIEVDYIPHDRTSDDGFCDRGERREGE